MIGGLADWFAIVALFRRPFGLPIPHTAIIPANKARIGRSLGDFLGHYLLDEKSLEGLLRSLDLAPQAGRWLLAGDHAERVAERLLRQLPALSQLWDKFEGKQRLFAFAADLRSEIRDRLGAHSSRWLPQWVDQRLADLLSDTLIGLIVALQSPEHPWRRKLDGKIEDLPSLSARDPAWREWQSRLFADPVVQEAILELLAPLEGALDRQSLTALLKRLGDKLAHDRKWQETAQDWLERAAERVLLPRKQAIGEFTAKLVEGWDDADLIGKLEAEVGADLHYIRLNGTLVGGLVGLALFAVTQWLG